MEEVKEDMNFNDKPIIKDDEIDLIEVAKMIWNGRKLILKVTGVFMLLGIFIAFGSKVEYEASCKLMPESQEGMKPNLGGLGSLAGMAGIDLGTGGAGALTPELYPEIAKSVPFLLKILNEPIHFEKQDTTTTSYIYFKEVDKPSILSLLVKYTIMLPFQIKAWLTTDEKKKSINRKSDLIRLSKEDTELLEKFRERISVSVDSKSGIISLSAEMPDALASAEMAKLSVQLLTEYVTEYKISKAQKDLDFASERYNEAKTEFENSQEKLAIFTDRNKNVVTAFAQTEHQRLQNEYNINYEIYKGLVTQLEQAKFKVKEETPVFTVLEPVRIPFDKSKPNRKLLMFLVVILGFTTGIATIFFKKILSNKI